MEKIKLIILFFSCLSLAQVETYSSLDIVSIEKKGDSLFNAKILCKIKLKLNVPNTFVFHP